MRVGEIWKSGARGQGGTVILELAGTVDLGFLFWEKQVLITASREGARASAAGAADLREGPGFTRMKGGLPVRWRWGFRLARWRRREEGSITVEFALLMPFFLMLVFGIVDFGHAFYMKQIVTNASREGARYGTRYITDAGGTRILPKDLNISNYVKNTVLQNLLPSDANPQVTLGGPGSTETVLANLPGEDLSVTINATKTWFVIGHLVPGLGTSKTVSAATTMKCE
jgi:Flp pilus assembly protein TadG